MSQFIKSQVHSNLKKSEECYKDDDYKKYNCNKCRDLTFIIKDNTATPCECRGLIEAKNILRNSGISEEFRKKTFENYNYSFDTQSLDAFYKAKTYVKNFNEIKSKRNNSILFMGQVGSGKTHLSMAIANNLMDSGIGVIYMPFRDIITQIKQNIMDEEYYRKTISRYKFANVLLIDDLFKGSISKSDINIMFEIINYRYFNNLAMIISSEKRFDELIDIDEALGSRIIEMSKGYVVELKGRKLNYRLYGG
ncbi:ATP-binding protein [Clostridium sp. CCUG 7971]|nr:ATP-binding protein [Clostridium sp. CCUG 7971]